MLATPIKNDLIKKLQQDILELQGFRHPSLTQHSEFGLGVIENAFPNGIFPAGAIHEFISNAPEHAAATSGFMASLAGKLMKTEGFCLWIGMKRTLFPPALKSFGVAPERVIFIDVKKESDILWTIEQGLKCDALAAVVGELQEINLTASRRLQLAVEHSKVTGMIHRYNPKISGAVASVCRWKVTAVASDPGDGMPGMGFSRWHVALQKVRNGEPGSWVLEWSNDRFTHIGPTKSPAELMLRNTG